MNNKLKLIKVIANNFKEAWDKDFPVDLKVINEIEQTELATKFPNLFDAITGIIEFADDDGEVNV
jgi:hypothetical protein